MKKTVIILFVILIACAANASEESKFSGEGEIGFLMTSGNTETDSFTGKVGLKYETPNWLNEANLSALYRSEESENDAGEKEDKVSAEKYTASGKTGWKFNELNYLFIQASYEDDRFSGYDNRTTASIGYGRKLINTEKINLNIELGPGYRYDKLEGGETEDEAIFRGFGLFSYKFSDSASFQQDVTVEAGSDNTKTKAVSAVTAKIVGALAMKVSFTVDHNSSVPADKEKTDTETALTLVYSF